MVRLRGGIHVCVIGRCEVDVIVGRVSCLAGEAQGAERSSDDRRQDQVHQVLVFGGEIGGVIDDGLV